MGPPTMSQPVHEPFMPRERKRKATESKATTKKPKEEPVEDMAGRPNFEETSAEMRTEISKVIDIFQSDLKQVHTFRVGLKMHCYAYQITFVFLAPINDFLLQAHSRHCSSRQ